MKKAYALMASVFVYICLFQLFFHYFRCRDFEMLLAGFSFTVAAYYLIAGNLFHRCLKIKWWQMWVSMNIVGFLLCWPIYTYLEPWQEEVDILLFLMILIPSLCITWGVVAIGFLCVRLLSFFISRKQQT